MVAAVRFFFMNITSAPRPGTAMPLFAFLLETGLVLLVAGMLATLANPLAVADVAPGLGARYTGPWTPSDSLLAERAWNHAASGQRLIYGAAALGWLGLVLARRARRGAGALVLALMALGGLSIQAFGLAPTVWILVGTACAILALMRNLFGAATCSLEAGGPGELSRALVWPLFLLCGGLGWLWLTDFAARGPLDSRYVGIRHLDGLWLSMVALVLSCLGAEHLMRGMLSLASMLKRKVSSSVGVLALLSLAVTLAWLGIQLGATRPHISGEWSRWPLLICLAWFGFRRLDFNLPLNGWTAAGVTVRNTRDSLAVCLLSGATAAAIWIGSGDFGPAMVLTLVVILLTSATLCVPARSDGFARVAALALILGLSAGWVYVTTQVLPSHHSRAAARETMRVDPFGAASDQGATAVWLLHAAESGFGLARVPWCGARALTGMENCPPKGNGVGPAFAADLPMVGIAAAWGRQGASASLAALCTLLLAALASTVAAASTGRTLPVLRCWLVMAFVITGLIQIALVSAANFGILPLSGLGLPLLSIGTHSAVSLGIVLGFAAAPLPGASHVFTIGDS